jgi:hypothetical protein
MSKNISTKGKILEFLGAAFLIIIGAAYRLLPHNPNFVPIAAIALFGGAYFSKKIALVLPILAMIISDFFIGFYQFSLMASVYLSFLISIFLGFWIRNNKKWYNVAIASFLSSVIFYILTNFAVWAFTGWYPRNFSGLIESYTMALPFFRNTLFGDFFFVGLFFGIYEIVEALIKKRFTISETIPVFVSKV